MLEVFIGGAIALAGSWFAAWYQAKQTRKLKMEESIAENKVRANGEAYTIMKKVQSMLDQESQKTTLAFVLSKEEWFFNTRLFLPGKFPDKWMSIRNSLRHFVRGTTEDRLSADEMTTICASLDKWAEEAIKEIYKDMDLEPVMMENPQLDKA